MKKILIIIVIIVILISTASIVVKNATIRSNDAAEKDKSGRYLTIINNTNQIINEVHVTIGNGTEIENMKRINPDEKSFSIKIPKQYSEYDVFTITLIDRYGMEYQKKVSEVKKHGRAEVEIDQKNYIKNKGDFFDKIDKFFNGD